MSPEQAFLHAILDAPDDDAPRLMYADWLTERGDPRGEFIRIQCELAKLEPDDDRWTDLQDREQDLLGEHRETWAGPAAKVAEDYRFRRGFVEDISLDAVAFLERAEELFRETPVQRLALHRLGTLAGAIAERPELARLCGLDLARMYIGPADLWTLLDSTDPARLRELGLHACSIGTPGVRLLMDRPIAERLTFLDLGNNHLPSMARPLAGARRLTRLTVLRLDGNMLTGDEVQALALAPNLASLRVLRLEHNQIDASGVRALAESKHLAGLTDLRLGGNRLGPESVRLLAQAFAGLRVLDVGNAHLGPESWRELRQSPDLARLHTLLLSGNNGGAEGGKALAASPHLSRLTHLDVSQCGLRDTGARALVESGSMSRLAILNLCDNAIGGPGVKAVFNSPFLARLRSLDLNRNYIGDATLEAVADSPVLARLTSLNLAATLIGPAGAAALAASPGVARLTKLDLSDTNIGDEGVRALASSPHLTRLRELWLHRQQFVVGGQVGSAAARALLESPYLTRLRRLRLSQCDLTDAEKQALRRRFGPQTVMSPGEEMATWTGA